MAKVTEYPNITSISGSNIYLYAVDTSGSTPVSGKISGSNLNSSISGSNSTVVATLDDLTNVSASSPNNNDILTYNSASGSWVAAEPTSGSLATLGSLADVSVPSPNNNDVLTWNTTTGSWIAVASGSSSVVATLDDLTNVSASSPNNNDVLIWNTTTGSWIASQFIIGTAFIGSASSTSIVTVNPDPADGAPVDSMEVITPVFSGSKVLMVSFSIGKVATHPSRYSFYVDGTSASIPSMSNIWYDMATGEGNGRYIGGVFYLTITSGSHLLEMWESAALDTASITFRDRYMIVQELITANTIVSTLDSLTDVSASSPNNNDVLIWNSTSGSWISSPVPALIDTVYASSTDAHTANNTWEDINSMSVSVITTSGSAKLFCTFTYKGKPANSNWEYYKTRFVLDDTTYSEEWEEDHLSSTADTNREMLRTTHTVFEGVTSGSHAIKTQWHDSNSQLYYNFYTRRLTVNAFQ